MMYIPCLARLPRLSAENQTLDLGDSPQQDVDSITCAQESASLLVIAPDERNNNNFGLLSLEIVDR